MTDSQVEGVRRFNRFYTRVIGLLRAGYLRSPWTLSEVRVLYEIAYGQEPTASSLARELDLGAARISRLVNDLEARGLIARRAAEDDRRRMHLSLTPRGEQAFGSLDAASSTAVRELLEPLAPADRQRLVASMGGIRRLFGDELPSASPVTLRTHRSGDLGWMVERHGVLYHDEYGWDERFEGLVARIVSDFALDHDPRRERCWIAERDGERVGSVMLVRHPTRRHVAQLRLLLVEPTARGAGVGRRLVHECSRFAARAGYRRITLWTNSVLHAARAIYEREGYVLLKEEAHTRFGPRLTGQEWEKELGSTRSHP